MRAGKFERDLTHVALRRPDGMAHEGMGTLHQAIGGGFEIKLFSPATMTLREYYQPLTSSKKAGEVFEDVDTFVMQAHDSEGGTWEADGIVNVEPDFVHGRPGYVATAKCRELRRIAPRHPTQKNNWLKLISFEEIECPSNVNRQVVTTVAGEKEREVWTSNTYVHEWGELYVRLTSENGFTAMLSACEKQLPQFADRRFVETMAFVLGKSPRWAITHRHFGVNEVISLYSPRPGNVRRQWPPMPMSQRDADVLLGQMIEKYLNFVIEDCESHTHPLSAIILDVRDAQDASLSAHAITVAVAVESILADYFPTWALLTPEQDKLIDALIEHVSKWSGDETLSKRARGTFSQFKKVRAGDRLYALQEAGRVTSDEVAAWSKIRNRAAHGSFSKKRSDFQTLLTQTHLVATLFNRLVYEVIGHVGKLANYGGLGWPIVDHPPGSNSSETTLPNAAATNG